MMTMAQKLIIGKSLCQLGVTHELNTENYEMLVEKGRADRREDHVIPPNEY